MNHRKQSEAGTEQGHSRGLVVAAILAVSLTFLAALTILYCYSCWQSPPPATSVLVIEDVAAYPNAILSVEGKWGAIQQRVTPQKSERCRFFLAGGIYTISVDWNGRRISQDCVLHVPNDRVLTLSMHALTGKATTRSGQAAGSR